MLLAFRPFIKVSKKIDLNSFRFQVDLKEQLLDWVTPTSIDESDEPIVSEESSTLEETSQMVPKRLADLRNQLANKQYAYEAAKNASVFEEKVKLNTYVLNIVTIFDR